MNRRTRVGTLAGLVLVALVGLPVLASAQAVCLLCESDGDQHWFWSLACVGTAPAPYTCAWCGYESACHADPQDGPCHESCSWGQGGPSLIELAQTAETLVEDTHSYGAEESTSALVSLINEDARLEFNPTRKAVQLLNCQRGVVGQWRVPDALAGALAQNLS